jgi:LuxR family transcriptional regulator, quorum-sensing system regulator SdiA
VGRGDGSPFVSELEERIEKSGLIDLNQFASLAPAGFYIAIRVGFAFPMIEHNRLPATWVREYTAGGLIVHDPVMSWAYRNCGVARWSELGESDSQGVLELAKNHGLNFGVVASCIDGVDAGQRSFGFFCRSDREYLVEELAHLREYLLSSHRAYAPPKNLTSAELQTLGLVKNGLLMKEIACQLGVSESAIKQRLKNARIKLNAKTGPQAAAKATMLGMI